jgi:hypothetical protein
MIKKSIPFEDKSPTDAKIDTKISMKIRRVGEGVDVRYKFILHF